MVVNLIRIINMKLIVSVPTFNEIASLLEKEGIKINSDCVLTLEKGIALVPPIDYRLVTIRRDCVIEATKVYRPGNGNFVELADEIYQYVLNEKL